MNKFITLFSVVFISIAVLSGCANQIYHDFIMSGQVVKVDDKDVLVCVANTEGLKADLIFNVYRTVNDMSAIPESDDVYTREFVGKIRLGKTRDEHFAEATVISGDIIPHDMVEFERDF